MAVSGQNSGSRLQSPQRTEQFPTCLAQQFAKPEPLAPCDAFLQPLHHPFLSDFADGAGLHECWDAAQLTSAHLPVATGPTTGGNVNEDRLSTRRRTHKADRERLRRDKLNEQFLELASALDPDRPKNDKATILGESVHVVRDLREEVKRLKTEHASLLDESRDLTQEKNELREEKAALKNETDQLQSQIQQRLRASSPWMGLDPSMMMGTTAFPYPVPVQQPISGSQTDSHPVSGPPRALVAPTPYMHLVPPLGAFHMHPSLQAYTMFGNRPGDGGCNPYLHYPAFSQPVNPHSHIERPYAQYPSAVQPIPGYVIQISPSLGSESQYSQPSSNSPVYKPCAPGIPVVPVAQNHGTCQRSKGGSNHSHASPCSSQHTLTDSKQEIASIVEPRCCLQDSGSSIIQGTSKESKNDEVKDVDLETWQINSIISTKAASTSAKEKLVFSSDQSGLSLATEGGAIPGKSGSESECELAHDPTLRPPAA